MESIDRSFASRQALGSSILLSEAAIIAQPEQGVCQKPGFVFPVIDMRGPGFSFDLRSGQQQSQYGAVRTMYRNKQHPRLFLGWAIRLIVVHRGASGQFDSQTWKPVKGKTSEAQTPPHLTGVRALHLHTLGGGRVQLLIGLIAISGISATTQKLTEPVDLGRQRRETKIATTEFRMKQ